MRRLRPQAWSASEPPARYRAVVGRALAGTLARTRGDPSPDTPSPVTDVRQRKLVLESAQAPL
jgi:hypothetical protein